MTIIYCDCFSGISGDMFLAAMLDAGLPEAYLSQVFDQLNLPEYHGVQISKVMKGPLAATQVEFNLEPGNPEHHPHARNLSEIVSLIQAGNLSATTTQNAIQFFQVLAEAEAKVHGTDTAHVHFHEVGAADSILDLVGAAAALDYFHVQRIYSSPVPLGSGQVRTSHGLLPIPAPATLELLSRAKAAIAPSSTRAELVTPTGAAILAVFGRFQQPSMSLSQTGMGAGKRDLNHPNILRVLLGNPQEEGTHVEIEANIDDMNPQIFGHVMQILFTAGALDVYFTPIYMKKNRPATKISVIARAEDEQTLAGILLRETSTLGVRVKPVLRHEVCREMREISTPFGPIPMKVKVLNGEVLAATPEFDICSQYALAKNVPLQQVFEAAAQAFQKDKKY